MFLTKRCHNYLICPESPKTAMPVHASPVFQYRRVEWVMYISGHLISYSFWIPGEEIFIHPSLFLRSLKKDMSKEVWTLEGLTRILEVSFRNFWTEKNWDLYLPEINMVFSRFWEKLISKESWSECLPFLFVFTFY